MPLVGYDSEHMTLDGKFNYEKERTLPFNVDIQPLPENKRMVLGSSSKANFRSIVECVRVATFNGIIYLSLSLGSLIYSNIWLS